MVSGTALEKSNSSPATKPQFAAQPGRNRSVSLPKSVTRILPRLAPSIRNAAKGSNNLLLADVIRIIRSSVPIERSFALLSLFAGDIVADSDDCGQAIRLNAAKRSDRRRAPFPTKATGLHCRHGDLGQGFFAASRLEVWAVIFRMLSPVSTRRCALWTRRSRTASAMVGSAMTSCQ